MEALLVLMRPFLVLLLSVTPVLLPSVVATWMSHGNAEPDTAIDRNGSFMFSAPDTSAQTDPPVRKVYFSGFGAQEGGYGVSVGLPLNANSAALASAIAPFPERPWALLGVWKDCNRDGYVGLGEQGAAEYSAALLLDPSVCPWRSLPRPIPDGWMPIHNDGMWIHELIPLGWPMRDGAGFPTDTDPFDIASPALRVWADDGRPGDPLTESSCYLFAPQGTYQRVGPLIDHVDCYVAGRANAGVAMVTERTAQGATWTSVRETRNPWGDERDSSVVYVWDCRMPIYSSATPVPVSVYRPLVPPDLDPSLRPSPAGTLSSLASGFDHCQQAPPENGDLHVGHELAHAPYALEEDANGRQMTVRHAADFAFHYSERLRPSGTVEYIFGSNTPSDGTGSGYSDAGGLWHSQTVRAVSRNPFVSRDALGPAPVRHMTYYGWVPGDLITKYGLTLPWSRGIYGSEACANGIGAGASVQKGWDCDPDHWYPNGTMPRSNRLSGRPWVEGDGDPIGGVVGVLYDLRDVDCYDASAKPLRDAGIGWGSTSGTRCVP